MRAFTKDIIREIRHSLGRFFSIMLIVAIGVAFFAGIKGSSADMMHSADTYFDAQNFQDIRILSTLGLTKEDVKALQEVDGVESVMGTCTKDFITYHGTSQHVTQVIGWSKEDPINQVLLMDGRYPTKDNECMLEYQKMGKSGFKIGDTITLKSGDDEKVKDSLKNNTYTIVGTCQTPNYLSYDKGASNIGSGSVDTFIMVPKTNFKFDYFTEIWLTVKGAKEINTYTDAYFDITDPVKDKIEELSKERKDIRYHEIKQEALDKWQEGYEEYLDGKKTYDKEIKEAETKLSDAKQELDDAKATLDDAKQELSDAKVELSDARQELIDGQATLDKNKKEFNAKIKEAKQTIKDNEDTLASGEKELQESEKQYNAGKKQYEDGLKEYNEGKEQYDTLVTTISTLQQNKTQLEMAINSGYLDEATLVLYQEQLAQINATLPVLVETEKTTKQTLATAKATLDASKKELDAASKQIATGKATIKKGKKELATAKKELATQEQDGKKQLQDAQTEIDEGWTAYNKGLKEYQEGLTKYEDGLKEYQDGLKEYQDGLKEFEDSRKDGLKELANARKDLDDAKEEIEDIEHPKWYVLDRNSHFSYRDYESVADRMDGIGKVFPVFFLLVAALVCLTTMTRMVDEQRQTIGTYKALGYSKGKILIKYIVYAFIAGIIGSVVGIEVGMRIFPTVIFNAWNLMYNIPALHFIRQPGLELFSSISVIGVILASTVGACYKELMEVPSNLMRPKAPKLGKKIFLEHIPFIWNHLSFTWKVTARNIFRYKKRFFMTIIGISGCTALLLAGFGIKDSIAQIVDIQYGELTNYDATCKLDSDSPLKERKQMIDELNHYDDITSTLALTSLIGTIEVDGDDENITIMIPDSNEAIDSYISLRERPTKTKLELQNDGVIISEKIASMLDLHTGDNVTFKDEDEHEFTVNITGITENYISHYIYMTPDYYHNLTGKYISENTVLIKMKEANNETESTLGNTFITKDCVTSLTFYRGVAESFDDTISSLSFITYVLIICAALLAFVVLYNLTNVNISERIREIATIKVLGFYDPEVASYVYKESIFLTLFGSIAGLGLGIILHRLIMNLAEMPTVMFGRNIDFISFIYSIVITLLFGLLVNVVMYNKLKKIPMVESLKSVE